MQIFSSASHHNAAPLRFYFPTCVASFTATARTNKYKTAHLDGLAKTVLLPDGQHSTLAFPLTVQKLLHPYAHYELKTIYTHTCFHISNLVSYDSDSQAVKAPRHNRITRTPAWTAKHGHHFAFIVCNGIKSIQSGCTPRGGILTW